MSDLELLFLALAVLYAWECSGWMRRGSVAFVNWFGRRWRLMHPGQLIGNQAGGLIFAPPLPPLGSILAGSQFPVSLSSEAALAFVSPSINPGWRPPQTNKLFRFEEINAIEARGKKVLVNGELFLKSSSSIFAMWLVEQMLHLKKLAAAKREKAIAELMRGRFDTKAIEGLWKDLQKKTATLQLLTNAVFIHLFIVSPMVLQRWSVQRSWPWLVTVLFALTVSTAILFRRLHKGLYPGAGEERFTHFLTIMLAPATTIRANDVLSRPLLENFHPLAIAKVFCSERDFREFAMQSLREVAHPALPVCPVEEPLARAAEGHTRGLLREIMQHFLKRNGLVPEDLLAPPAPTDENCQSYCPRCLAQFTSAKGTCADCGGLELAPLVRIKSKLETARVS
jgi:hypothetical protein